MEQFRTELLDKMADCLDNGQMERLERALTELLYMYEVVAKKDEVAIYDGTNDKMVNLYVASLRLEGKAEKTIEQYVWAIKFMLDELRKPIKEITTNDLRYHLASYQKERKISKSTLDNKRRYLSAFFSWLTVEEHITKNPMLKIKKIKQDKIIKKPFSDVEVERIRDTVKGDIRDRTLIEFLMSTGCRVSEITRLNIEDIDFNTEECIVFGKGNKERRVYINARCKYCLLAYLTARGDKSGALFLNRRGKRISKQNIEELMSKIGKNAGISKVHPHRFRRTFATRAINRGMPVQHVQKILGHNSLDTTMIYCTLDDEEIKHEHKRIAA